MRITPPFPEDRRQDPLRQAELRVYEQLMQSTIAGHALYEAKANRHCRELDFLVILEDTARIGIEVKGGQYRIEGGKWHLQGLCTNLSRRGPSSARALWVD